MDNLILVRDVEGFLRKRITILPRVFDLDVCFATQCDDDDNEYYTVDIIFMDGYEELCKINLSVDTENEHYAEKHSTSIINSIMFSALRSVVDFLYCHKEYDDSGNVEESKYLDIDEFTDEMQDHLDFILQHK